MIHGVLAHSASAEHPTRLAAWRDGTLTLEADGTDFFFCAAGTAELSCDAGTFPLVPGMYGSVPGAGQIGGDGRGLVITRLGHRGLFHIGGPVEDKGRLRYIDGCTDTLLIAPPLRGDPCLNLLHIPPHTHQTRHTHPSMRAGLIVSGAGRCVTPAAKHTLEPGLAFVIPAGGQHSFHTDEQPLRVIAYHPDSDYGPSHDHHPMVNRTMVEDVSAARLDALRTTGGEEVGG